MRETLCSDSPSQRRGERGFILALALFGVIALTIVGVTAVYLASGEASMAGNLRQQRQLQACSDAGVQSLVAQLPSLPVSAYNYGVTPSYSASKGHYNVTDVATSSDYEDSMQLPASVLPDIAGENLSNRIVQGGGDAGLKIFRLVSTCSGPGSAMSESEGVFMLGFAR